jgi:hypothetical protein
MDFLFESSSRAHVSRPVSPFSTRGGDLIPVGFLNILNSPIAMKLPASFFLLFILLAQQSFAQRIISGVVSDAENREPLTGASVLLKGTGVATITDNNGNSPLRLIPGPGHSQ